MKKAILFGASGFIGENLLHELLNSPDYEQVTIVVRRKLHIDHLKLKTLIGDFNTLSNLKAELVGDEIFIAIGTTKKHTPDQSEYYQIDHDYPLLAAQIAKEKNAKSVFVVSAVGANKESNVFYIRTKGELERDLIALNFNHTHIFRPSMIMGNRKENRPFEKVLINIFSLINPLFMGKLNKYKGIEGATIAKAMVKAAKNQHKKVTVYEWKEMNKLTSAD